MRRTPRQIARRLAARALLVVFLLPTTVTAGEPEDAAARDKKARATLEAARAAKFVRAATAARHGVVRVSWRNDTNPKDKRVRNAIVVSSAGHLLLAGPLPALRRGTLYAEFADGNTVKAKFVAWDETSGLTLLHVNYRDLTPLTFGAPSLAPRVAPVSPTRTAATSGQIGKQPKRDGAPDTAASAVRPRPLGTVPLGTEVIMITGDGAVARGRIRAQERRIPVFDPETGLPKTLGALVEAGIAAVPSDQGSPWLDAEGQVVALQVATGFAETLPEAAGNAGAVGLRSRITPSASLGIPVSVLRIVTPLLLKRRGVHRAGLGIDTRACTEHKRNHLAGGRGCHEITRLDPKGAGARAGLQLNDVIVGVEGEALRPRERLADALLPYRPGQQVRLDILRIGKRLSIDVKLTERSAAPK